MIAYKSDKPNINMFFKNIKQLKFCKFFRKLILN